MNDMSDIQKRALSTYGDMPDLGSGGIDHVLVAVSALRKLLDAETRHVTLSVLGLGPTLAGVFGECVCVLRGRNYSTAGRHLAMPLTVQGVCDQLRDVFEDKNKIYDNSFTEHGAVGVVIRLLDQASKARTMAPGIDRDTAIVHIANFASMAMLLLVDREPETLA